MQKTVYMAYTIFVYRKPYIQYTANTIYSVQCIVFFTQQIQCTARSTQYIQHIKMQTVFFSKSEKVRFDKKDRAKSDDKNILNSTVSYYISYFKLFYIYIFWYIILQVDESD